MICNLLFDMSKSLIYKVNVLNSKVFWLWNNYFANLKVVYILYTPKLLSRNIKS
jgi:hypothetical protein